MSDQFRILAVGDVVGSPGRKAIRALLPSLVREQNIDMTIVNAENAAGGSGVTANIVDELLSAGVACLTSGDHAFRKKDVMEVIDHEDRFLRPLNISRHAAGRGWTVVETDSGARIAIINLIGRAFMQNANNPFEAVESVLEEIQNSVNLTVVDFHAEATAEKMAMGHFLDGRVAALWGTHTHVQTADETVLAGGTGYITDLGMTGGHDGIIGRKCDGVIEHLRCDMPTRWEIATGDIRLCGAIFTVNLTGGRCLKVERVQSRLES